MTSLSEAVRSLNYAISSQDVRYNGVGDVSSQRYRAGRKKMKWNKTSESALRCVDSEKEAVEVPTLHGRAGSVVSGSLGVEGGRNYPTPSLHSPPINPSRTEPFAAVDTVVGAGRPGQGAVGRRPPNCPKDRSTSSAPDNGSRDVSVVASDHTNSSRHCLQGLRASPLCLARQSE